MFQLGKAAREAENEARNMVMKNLMAVKTPKVAVVFASNGSEGLL